MGVVSIGELTMLKINDIVEFNISGEMIVGRISIIFPRNMIRVETIRGQYIISTHDIARVLSDIEIMLWKLEI